jgi:hypothetical protein
LDTLVRRTAAAEFEFAVLRRADDANWQGIAGGGEGGESGVQAARREALEEAAIPPTASLYRLATNDTVPVACFRARDQWPPDLYVVPQSFFACDVTGMDVTLSESTATFDGRRSRRHSSCCATTATGMPCGSLPSDFDETTYLNHAVPHSPSSSDSPSPRGLPSPQGPLRRWTVPSSPCPNDLNARAIVAFQELEERGRGTAGKASPAPAQHNPVIPAPG